MLTLMLTTLRSYKLKFFLMFSFLLILVIISVIYSNNIFAPDILPLYELKEDSNLKEKVANIATSEIKNPKLTNISNYINTVKSYLYNNNFMFIKFFYEKSYNWDTLDFENATIIANMYLLGVILYNLDISLLYAALIPGELIDSGDLVGSDGIIDNFNNLYIELNDITYKLYNLIVDYKNMVISNLDLNITQLCNINNTIITGLSKLEELKNLNVNLSHSDLMLNYVANTDYEPFIYRVKTTFVQIFIDIANIITINSSNVNCNTSSAVINSEILDITKQEMVTEIKLNLANLIDSVNNIITNHVYHLNNLYANIEKEVLYDLAIPLNSLTFTVLDNMFFLVKYDHSILDTFQSEILNITEILNKYYLDNNLIIVKTTLLYILIMCVTILVLLLFYNKYSPYTNKSSSSYLLNKRFHMLATGLLVILCILTIAYISYTVYLSSFFYKNITIIENNILNSEIYKTYIIPVQNYKVDPSNFSEKDRFFYENFVLNKPKGLIAKFKFLFYWFSLDYSVYINLYFSTLLATITVTVISIMVKPTLLKFIQPDSEELKEVYMNNHFDKQKENLKEKIKLLNTKNLKLIDIPLSDLTPIKSYLNTLKLWRNIFLTDYEISNYQAPKARKILFKKSFLTFSIILGKIIVYLTVGLAVFTIISAFVTPYIQSFDTVYVGSVTVKQAISYYNDFVAGYSVVAIITMVTIFPIRIILLIIILLNLAYNKEEIIWRNSPIRLTNTL